MSVSPLVFIEVDVCALQSAWMGGRDSCESITVCTYWLWKSSSPSGPWHTTAQLCTKTFNSPTLYYILLGNQIPGQQSI